MGWSTMIPEATSVEEASEKVQEGIRNLGPCFWAFQNNFKEMYLSSIVEVKMLLDGEVQAHFELSEQRRHLDARALPSVSEELCVITNELASDEDAGGGKVFVSFRE